MRCPTCSRDYPAGHRFCEVDGSALVASGAPTPSASPGPAVASSAHEPAPPAQAPPPTGDSATHPGLLVLLGAVGCALLLLLGFLAFESFSGSEEPRSPSSADYAQTDRGDAAIVEVEPADEMMEDVYEDDGLYEEEVAYDEADSMMEEAPERDLTYRPPPPSNSGAPSSTVRQTSVPGGTAYVVRSSNDELRLVVSGSVGRRDAPRPLSTDTRFQQFEHRRVAGRDVVMIRAYDDRWQTTYFWEYRPNLMHFVAEDRNNGEVNVSRQPGTEAIMRDALGYVPTRTWRSRAEREAAAEENKRFNVILGAYTPSQDTDYRDRLRQVQASRWSIKTASSESLRMRPGYRIIYVGPFDERADADRVRNEMLRYASDAYVSNAR